MNELFFLLTFLFLSTAFAIASIAAGFILGYRSYNTDNSTYECGVKIFGNAKIRYDVKFLNYAILFLIFDVNVFFLFPLAVALNIMSLFNIFEIILFVSITMVALILAIRKNILRWF